jgi:DNA-binding protein Fis
MESEYLNYIDALEVTNEKVFESFEEKRVKVVKALQVFNSYLEVLDMRLVLWKNLNGKNTINIVDDEYKLVEDLHTLPFVEVDKPLTDFITYLNGNQTTEENFEI